MLTGYQEVARFVGLDSLKMLAHVRLRAAALQDPENWLPASRVLALIDDSATVSDRDDFGVLLGRCRTFTSLGPVSLLLKHEATVRDIIEAAMEYRYLLNDLIHIDVRDDGENAVVEWCLIPGLQSAQGVNLVAAIVYKSVSEALELTWKPDCIHFRHSRPKHVETFKTYFHCALEFDSDFDGMSCSSKALIDPNPFADGELAGYARKLLDLLPGVRDNSVTDKVRSVILLMIQDGHTSAERAAECLGVPVRTLQRRLISEGQGFSSLLNDIRRELVLRYLANTTHPMTVIAHLTGYSSTSAFSRWFAAEFGKPPARWRNHYRSQHRESGGFCREEFPPKPETLTSSERPQCGVTTEGTLAKNGLNVL